MPRPSRSLRGTCKVFFLRIKAPLRAAKQREDGGFWELRAERGGTRLCEYRGRNEASPPQKTSRAWASVSFCQDAKDYPSQKTHRQGPQCSTSTWSRNFLEVRQSHRQTVSCCRFPYLGLDLRIFLRRRDADQQIGSSSAARSGGGGASHRWGSPRNSHMFFNLPSLAGPRRPHAIVRFR
jgi:hypothetical protein